MHCPNCGKEIPRGARHCASCGAKVGARHARETAGQQSRTVRKGPGKAAIICAIAVLVALVAAVALILPRMRAGDVSASEEVAATADAPATSDAPTTADASEEPHSEDVGAEGGQLGQSPDAIALDDGREPGEELVDVAQQVLVYWCGNYLDSGVGEPTEIPDDEWTTTLRGYAAEGGELYDQAGRPEEFRDWVAAEKVSYQEVLELAADHVTVRVTIEGTQSSWNNTVSYTEDWRVSFDDQGKVTSVELVGASYL